MISATFTVFFEAPFWKGLYERIENNQLSVAIVVFGAEPKDVEVAQFIAENFKVLSFSKKQHTEQKNNIKNFKKMQRDIKKQTKQIGIGTKSQQALQQQREQFKMESKSKRKLLKKQLQQQQFEQKQIKKKQKRKGK